MLTIFDQHDLQCIEGFHSLVTVSKIGMLVSISEYNACKRETIKLTWTPSYMRAGSWKPLLLCYAFGKCGLSKKILLSKLQQDFDGKS